MKVADPPEALEEVADKFDGYSWPVKIASVAGYYVFVYALPRLLVLNGLVRFEKWPGLIKLRARMLGSLIIASCLILFGLGVRHAKPKRYTDPWLNSGYCLLAGFGRFFS